MPRRFEVLSGTVAILGDDRRPAKSTHQLDVIVADTLDFPTLVRSGDVAVVLAQSVRAVMEVKSDLKRGVKFMKALVQIARARQMLKATDPVFTCMFSFDAPAKPETLRDWLEDVVALRTLRATGRGDEQVVGHRDARSSATRTCQTSSRRTGAPWVARSSGTTDLRIRFWNRRTARLRSWCSWTNSSSSSRRRRRVFRLSDLFRPRARSAKPTQTFARIWGSSRPPLPTCAIFHFQTRRG